MRFNHLLLVLPLAMLTACSSTITPHDRHGSPETMLITYHVKPGQEAELQDVLTEAWKIYRAEHMVLDQPHTVLLDKEAGDKTRILEIFTWVSHSVPDHAPDSVRKIWERMQSLCEERGGHGGLELGEVDLLVPKR